MANARRTNALHRKGVIVLKKRAVVILSYEDEQELNRFIASRNASYVEILAMYENLDAADAELIEGIIEDKILPEE